ncbi:MAG: hypothetical protein EHM72_09950 [Calditrichaeota bacterium]|nr:MAG: hypothetical protein EHM72_09950 [Calditrichota bacterium]
MKLILHLIIPSLIVIAQLDGCTIFTIHRGSQVLAGNNEDSQYSTAVKIWFVPPTAGRYGRICFGWNQLFFFRQAQGGMNDQGLFFDWALCPDAVPPKFSLKNKVATFNMPENLLAECATVDEAVAWLGRFNILFIRSHIMLADRRGNSAVVEWVDGEFRVIKKNGDIQVITNFWLSHPELGNYPCPRYDRVTESIKAMPIISVERLTSTLEDVSTYERTKDGNEYGTLYSNVYDLTHGDVYIYFKRGFDIPLNINLEFELKRGKRVYLLESLF